jgi:uncharacterized repeat protein (TIGR03943 family)
MVIGVIAALAALNGLYLNFVKPSLRLPLLVASAVLLLLGAHGAVTDRGAGGADGHDHGGGTPRVGWLLVVPFLLLGVVVPPPLGAYSAAEDTGLVTVSSAEGLGPLPDDDPVDLTLAEFQGRALFDPDRSLQGRTVRLVGFASPGTGGQWVLTRMSLNCCAADGFAVKVRVAGAPAVADDEWVRVTGTWRPAPIAAPESRELPVLDVRDLIRVPMPENPYE